MPRRKKMENISLEEQLVTVEPVSYTHLDVYKRQAYENPDRSGGIPRETGRKFSEDLDQGGQDRPLQHVGNDQSSDTGGYGSTETGYGGDHSAQDQIKQEKTEEDTEKGTASAVP